DLCHCSGNVPKQQRAIKTPLHQSRPVDPNLKWVLRTVTSRESAAKLARLNVPDADHITAPMSSTDIRKKILPMPPPHRPAKHILFEVIRWNHLPQKPPSTSVPHSKMKG